MIHYKDMTFCPFHEDCKKAKECQRPLTEEVKDDADIWWGGNKGEAPICMFSEKPSCHEKSS